MRFLEKPYHGQPLYIWAICLILAIGVPLIIFKDLYWPPPSVELTTSEASNKVENVAKGKKSEQSSTHQKGSADRANDGDTKGQNNHNQTEQEDDPWWQVDLGDTYSIEDIRIYNRTTKEQKQLDRLSDFYVLVSDEEFDKDDLDDAKDDATFKKHITETAGQPTKVSVNKTGRYVRIQINGDNARLHMSEVEVHGNKHVEKTLEITEHDAQEITKDSARITWKLNDKAQGFVEYGTSKDYGGKTIEEKSFNFDKHGQTIKDLEPGTKYYYRITSTDKNGKEATAKGDFTTEGGASSITFHEVTNITKDSARIHWKTEEKSQGFVSYGTTKSYGKTTTEEKSFNFSEHGQNIKDLTPNTKYYFQITATSESGEEKTETGSFTTLSSVERELQPIGEFVPVDGGEASPTTQCSDGIDNDSDGFIDTNDWDCENTQDDTEFKTDDTTVDAEEDVTAESPDNDNNGTHVWNMKHATASEVRNITEASGVVIDSREELEEYLEMTPALGNAKLNSNVARLYCDRLQYNINVGKETNLKIDGRKMGVLEHPIVVSNSKNLHIIGVDMKLSHQEDCKPGQVHTSVVQPEAGVAQRLWKKKKQPNSNVHSRTAWGTGLFLVSNEDLLVEGSHLDMNNHNVDAIVMKHQKYETHNTWTSRNKDVYLVNTIVEGWEGAKSGDLDEPHADLIQFQGHVRSDGTPCAPAVKRFVLENVNAYSSYEGAIITGDSCTRGATTRDVHFRNFSLTGDPRYGSDDPKYDRLWPNSGFSGNRQQSDITFENVWYNYPEESGTKARNFMKLQDIGQWRPNVPGIPTTEVQRGKTKEVEVRLCGWELKGVVRSNPGLCNTFTPEVHWGTDKVGKFAPESAVGANYVSPFE